MQSLRNIFAILTAAILAGCATQTPEPPEPPGRHLLVRDGAGKMLMQFDYPTDQMCGDTAKAMRGSRLKAGCSQTSSAESLRGRATLRYNPPGVLVHGHYQDLAACRTETAQLSPGVSLLQPCTAK